MSARKKASPAAAEACIRGRSIVIELPIRNLRIAVDGGVALGRYASPFKVTDATAFAKDVVRALNEEDEEGTNRIHKLFDEAFEAAVNDGAQGWADAHEPEDA